jgi:O-antigen/teichoic acid export membrane protein
LTANLVANVWSALVSIIAVPFYVHFLGIEGYGLVGIFALLLAIGSLIDVGLSATVTRELAGSFERPSERHHVRDLVRTSETLFWGAALAAGVLVGASSAFVAGAVQSEAISSGDATLAVALMAIALALQLPIGLYTGVLLGRHKQVMLAKVTIAMYTLRGVGAVAVLAWVSSSVTAFFLWQALAAAMHTMTIASLSWAELRSPGHKPRVDFKIITSRWRFAAGIAGITVTGVAVTQLDRVLLLQFVSLEEFGYYALATVAASVLSYLVAPFFALALPALTTMVASGDRARVLQGYVTITEVLSVLIVPAGAVLIVFTSVIMNAWLRDPAKVDEISLLVSLLAAGAALHALVVVPYALQVAHGKTRLVLMANVISIVILVPLLVVLIALYGTVGATLGALVYNVGYLCVVVPLMHRNLPFTGFGWPWCRAVIKPAVPALLIVSAGRLGQPSGVSATLDVMYACCCGLVALAAGAVAAPSTRGWLVQRCRGSLAWAR